MNRPLLPRRSRKPLIPPIKCQGIKTKLADFILSNIKWDGNGCWIEPFLGSGVVLFNVEPERAIAYDTNAHIIGLYRKISEGAITPQIVKDYLAEQGRKLLKQGEDYYYQVRNRFNATGDALDFLFLNRSCFNGVMRFNRQGKFNVPFCRKPERFRQAYITKIANQVAAIQKVMKGKQWQFEVGDWRSCLKYATMNDFVYLDPPYIGRHTDYYDKWSEQDARELAIVAQALPCGFALSMWKENKYRSNNHLTEHWSGLIERTFTHFYHVGSTENLRNSMEEALLIKPGYETSPAHTAYKPKVTQIAMVLSEKPKARTYHQRAHTAKTTQTDRRS